MEPLDDPTIFVAWEQVEDQRWLLADEYGSLYFIMLVADERGRVQGFQLDLLGKTSRASSLTYLDGGYVFIGSHQGDSQLIQIVEGGLVVPQTFSNIAPILDFTIMDMGSRAGEGQTSEYSSGQARIVTGSGAFQDGSLRSVRSGVGLEVLGELGQYEHSTSLFALRTGGESSSIDMLAISFVDQTRLLKFSSEGHVEELQEYDGFELAEQTVFAANISANRLLQCTNSGVRVFDLENGMVTANWLPPQGLLIVAASANSTHLALSLNGVEAAVLALPDLGVIAQKKFSQENQISCIEVPDIMSGICLVGFWQTGKVSVLNVDGLSDIQTIQVSRDPAAMPRSILLTQIIPNQPPTLLIAMADGNIVSYKFSTTEYSLSGRKNVILGTQEARFSALPRGDGLYNVFATCEHPTLIYASEGRVVYSAVNADQALYICPFDSEAWPGAIAIATPTEIKLALVDTERTTHVQTLPIGDTVRRIAYSTSQRAFGLGTVHRTLKEGVEIVQSHFKLADEVVFGELDTYDLNEEELVESVIRADLVEDSGDTVERFVVGTAYLDDNNESVRGRILVFEVTSDRKLKVVAEHAVKGACRVLNVMDGKIVAGLVRTVSARIATGIERFLMVSRSLYTPWSMANSTRFPPIEPPRLLSTSQSRAISLQLPI